MATITTLQATSTTLMPSSSSSSLSVDSSLSTGEEVRLACRGQSHTACTSGLAPTYLQANLLVLPSHYASDFRLLCHRNPVPCPLLAESNHTGSFSQLRSHLSGIATSDKIARDIDLRHDAPRYNVYEHGKPIATHIADVEKYWRDDDHVAFLIGCSFSFETALAQAGLTPAHTLHGRNVPMYRTNIPLCPAGVFTHSTYVVSMRAYRKRDIERVRSLTRPYTATHGEPIAWDWDGARRIGVDDISVPQWGDAPLTPEGRPLTQGGVDPSDNDNNDDEYVPVFWGCGVTPQEAVMNARIPGTVLAHAPGHMLVLDLRDGDIRGE